MKKMEEESKLYKLNTCLDCWKTFWTIDPEQRFCCLGCLEFYYKDTAIQSRKEKSRKTNKNYIGMTGITEEKQLFGIDSIFRNGKFPNQNHDIMIGILISPRNLDKTWFSSRYPNIWEIKNILQSLYKKEKYKDFFNTLHIDEKANSNWEYCLELLINKIGIIPKGIQVNVKHPKVKDIKRLSERFPETQIIFQYSGDFLNKDIKEAMKDLSVYTKYIDYVLIDPSRGRGLELNSNLALKHFIQIKKDFNHLNVALAGGFNHKNIRDYVKAFKASLDSFDFSLDIESGVRDNDDKLDLIKFESYIQNLSKELYI
jgi:phosphoribosylanthranilate isomerase